MQKRILFTAVTALLFFFLINSGCSKLDTTNIGTDLLPAVDNVHTFADTISNLITTQGTFLNDTTYLAKSDNHVLGIIPTGQDPLFGGTTANIYLQLKPLFYPYYIGGAKDTLNGYGAGLDSIVLCLSYKAMWGDSTSKIRLEVHEVTDAQFRDSGTKRFDINYHPTISGTVLGSTDVDLLHIGDTIHYADRRDTSVNLIRIKIPASSAWATQLYNRDSLAGQAFLNDSLYKRFYNGLAVIATGATSGKGALMYVNLSDTSTKLEIHYRRRNYGVLDTVYTSFKLNPVTGSYSVSQPSTSSTANWVSRSRSGGVLSPTTSELYLQTSPGTYVNINIPGISAWDNRIIHRAELIIQQIPSGDIITDNKIFTPPAFVYVDLKDTGAANVWKPIYYDLNPSSPYDPDTQLGIGFLPAAFDYATFGGYRRDGTDKFGNPIKYYNINISRYVQQLVTKHTPNYQLRLYAPYELYYPNYANADYPAYYTAYGNNLAAGRIKIGGGANPNYRMILRVVYSKL